MAKCRGIKVTADVSVSNLHLSDIDIGYYDSNCRLIPPLRDSRDRESLRDALTKDSIDLIVSNHTPVNSDYKNLPFGESLPGASGIETLLPLTLKWADEENISLCEALRKITTMPAEVLGLPKPSLSVGEIADFCIFDPDKYWQLGPDSFFSKGKNSPFIGLELKGKVIYTIINGKIAFEEGVS